MLKVNKMEKASLTCFNARTNKRILTHASSAWLSVRVLPSPHGKRHFQLRRMAQFSATPQIDLFQPSFRIMEPLPLQHSVRQQKMLTIATDARRRQIGHESALLPFCLRSAFVLPPFCLRLAVRQTADLRRESNSANEHERKNI